MASALKTTPPKAGLGTPKQPTARGTRAEPIAAGKGRVLVSSGETVSAQPDFLGVYRMTLPERVAMVHQGVKAQMFKGMVEAMQVPQDTLSRKLRISVATVNRRASRDEVLSVDESERVVNMASLVGQVEAMVGTVEGFNAAHWLAGWIEQPVPALGGRRPSEFLDTSSGIALVSSVLAAIEGGAYL
ncbi:MAG: DUF2384 domain-containing protein [Burkholderiales bacterium]|nr:DUF2384 domain-containing protein [Burkholderiales bacterium]